MRRGNPDKLSGTLILHIGGPGALSYVSILVSVEKLTRYFNIGIAIWVLLSNKVAQYWNFDLNVSYFHDHTKTNETPQY